MLIWAPPMGACAWRVGPGVAAPPLVCLEALAQALLGLESFRCALWPSCCAKTPVAGRWLLHLSSTCNVVLFHLSRRGPSSTATATATASRVGSRPSAFPWLVPRTAHARLNSVRAAKGKTMAAQVRSSFLWGHPDVIGSRCMRVHRSLSTRWRIHNSRPFPHAQD